MGRGEGAPAGDRAGGEGVGNPSRPRHTEVTGLGGNYETPDTPVEPSSGAPYPGNVEARLAVLEHVTETNAETFGRLERRFDVVDRRFEMIDRRFEAIDCRFEAIERRLDSIIHGHRADFRWLIGAMTAGFGALLGVMAHGFHWF